MVQRLLSHRIPRRPFGAATKNIHSSNDDDSNRTQSLSDADDALLAASMPPLKNFMDHCNPEVCEITYRLNSGKVFRMTRAHPDAQEIHIEDLPERPCHLSTLEALESHHRSERRQTRNLPRAGPHSRTPRRKRRDSSSTTSPLPTKRQSIRKRRADSYSDSESESDPDSEDEDKDEDKDETVLLDGIETEMQWVKVSDLHHVYYTTAFRSINQLCCKDISKAWIRLCHPKKQTTHPYNGGKTGRRSKSELRYQGHYTAPDYWPSDENWDGLPVPSGCRHKEPDHLKKPERIILLVHLLGSQYKGFKDGDFSLEKLIQSTNSVIHLLEKKKHWTTSHVEKLQEIYRVRAKELEFERKEIDGDTLVNVQMPKLRCKGRKPPPSTINKAATPLNKLAEKEAEDEDCRAQHAAIPIASMGVNAQSEDECVGSSEGSEPSIPAPADTLTPAEEIAPDVSGPESISCQVPIIQRDLPFSGLPSATRTRLNCVQDGWAQHQADIGQDPTSSKHPNAFGTVMTAGEAQSFLPSRKDFPSKSSSMESFPSQVMYPQYDHESTVSQRFPHRMNQNDTFSPDDVVRNIVPKVEIVRRPTFAASSSGLVGAFAIDAQYSSWQTENLWHAQMEPSIYTAVADPTIGLLPSTNGSFSGGYSGASSGPPLETWNKTPGHRDPVQEGLDPQGATTPWHLPLGLRTSSSGNSNTASRSSYNTDFGTHSSLMTESNFGQYFQDQQQR